MKTKSCRPKTKGLLFSKPPSLLRVVPLICGEHRPSKNSSIPRTGGVVIFCVLSIIIRAHGSSWWFGKSRASISTSKSLEGPCVHHARARASMISRYHPKHFSYFFVFFCRHDFCFWNAWNARMASGLTLLTGNIVNNPTLIWKSNSD